MKLNHKKILISIFSLAILLIAGHIVFAQTLQQTLDPAGLDGLENTGLADTNPQLVALRIIRFFLGFLGIVAVSLVMYAGWLWMSAGGNYENIEKAKKILTGAAIGIILIFSSFAIVSWLISNILDATGANSGSGNNNISNGTGNITPNSAFYVMSTTPHNNEEGVFRNNKIEINFNNNFDSTLSTSSIALDFKLEKIATVTLDIATGILNRNSLITPVEATGTIATTSNNSFRFYVDSTCTVGVKTIPNCLDEWSEYRMTIASTSQHIVNFNGDNVNCGVGKGCEFYFVTYDGIDIEKPVIRGISPAGGFCRTAADVPTDRACINNSDCASTETCDRITPNGKEGNFVTIFGQYFGTTTRGHVYFASSTAAGGWIEAYLADNSATGNSQCGSKVWDDTRIIVVVPSGIPNFGTSSIRVRAAYPAPNEDVSNDTYGPRIKDFLGNDIDRPGICGLSPNHGRLSDPFDYQGIKMLRATGYFGDLDTRTTSTNPVTIANATTAPAVVQNLAVGTTSAFVLNLTTKAFSNFDYFHKDAEPYSGPFITSISPISGPPGQYITIRGGRFGFRKGTSMVYFSTNSTGANGDEANFNFPEICADSIWSDEQIIIKAPTSSDAHYYIKVAVGGFVASSDDIPSGRVRFDLDASYTLTPGLCRLEPTIAQNGDEISLWGEYFGVQATGEVRYNNQAINIPGASSSVWGVDNSQKDPKPDKATSIIPQNVISNPVHIFQATSSNPMNLQIGECHSNADCGVQFCCAQGSPKAGRCAISTSKCFDDILTSSYEFEFSTMISTTTPCDGNINTAACDANATLCPQNQPFCDNNTCACTSTNPIKADFCSGYDIKQCGYDFCPNAPGRCGIATTTVSGSCDCEKLNPKVCKGGNCGIFNNYCIQDTVTSTNPIEPNDCDRFESYPMNFIFSGISTDYLATSSLNIRPSCSLVGTSTYFWQYDFLRSCYSTTTATSSFYSFRDINGKCTIASSTAAGLIVPTCNPCPKGFSCVDNGTSTDNLGFCGVNQPVCAAGSSCNAGTGECDYANGKEPTSCQCCCSMEGNNLLASIASSQDCCLGLSCENDLCGDPLDNYGKCSGCTTLDASGNKDQALSDLKCSCAGHTGQFCEMNGAGGKGVCSDCSALNTPSQCSQHAGSCCVDATKGNACGAGVGSTTLVALDNPDLAYCPYYACTDPASTTANGCNNAVASSSFPYKDSVGSCNSSCTLTLPGTQCLSAVSTTTCDTSLCTKLECRNASSTLGVTPTTGANAYPECGTCCCDPGKTSDTWGPAWDKCNDLGPGTATGTTMELSCKPNQSPCSGGGRGLCCGCENDLECGDYASNGCGLDTCCRARPNVASTYPANGATSTCRNTEISAKFNTAMDVNSLMKNVIVVGDYGVNQCPNGTRYLSMKKEYRGPLAIQLADRIVDFFMKVPVLNRMLFGDSAIAQAGINYCAIEGAITGRNISSTTAQMFFGQKNLLAASTTYYVIIKGDASTTDAAKEGVLSLEKVSMNNIDALWTGTADDRIYNGITFNGAKIWRFTTMSDIQGTSICLPNSVVIEPSSYLFQTTRNNITDDNPTNLNTYDTIADADKAYRAQALSTEGQSIVSTPGLSWDWSWAIANKNIVDFVSTSTISGVVGEALVRAASTTSDGHTKVEANLNILSGPMVSAPFSIKGEADAYVFICTNPWPAIQNSASGPTWSPFVDTATNCNVTGPIGCTPMNQELYFCRDANGPGIGDDLPALIDPAIIRGSSTNSNVLKEYLFTRGKYNYSSGSTFGNLAATSSPDGKNVNLSWNTEASSTGYIVYYGLSGQALSQEQRVNGQSTPTTTISSLTLGQSYCFEVAAINANNVQSQRTSQKCIGPLKDTLLPAMPINFNAVSGNKRVSLNWGLNATDTVGYIISYGLSLNYGTSLNIPANASSTVINNLADGVLYNFSIVAVDASGNHSPANTAATSTAIKALPAKPNNFAAISGNKRISLSWDLNTDDTSGYIISYGTSTSYGININISRTASSTVINNLATSTLYNFSIVAVNASGYNSSAATAATTTAP